MQGMPLGGSARLRCTGCAAAMGYDPLAKFCPWCGKPLVAERPAPGALRVRGRGVWAYSRVLPLGRGVTLGEGGTALVRAGRLGEALGLGRLYLKNESLNPTGTFIDRGVAVDVSVAVELGYRRVVAPSLGDYGVSVAAYAAKAGLRALIFTPRSVEPNKLYQVVLMGGKVRLLDTYTDCVEEAVRYSERYGYYLSLPSSHTVLDGYKTIAYEILRDLGETPGYVVVPAGDGALISALHLGFQEARRAGLLEGELPRLVAVQTEASPVIAMRVLGREIRGAHETLAKDLLVANPLMGDYAVRAIRETRGTAVVVSDRDIVRAMHLLARHEGIVAEPSSATAVAGLARLAGEGLLDSDSSVVVVVTGSAFKDPVLLKRVAEQDREAGRELSALEEGERVGETKLRILEILAVGGEAHPYRVWQTLRRVYGSGLKPATIYQHLKQLEARGLVVGKRVGRRIVYRLTGKGRSVVEKYRESLEG